MNSFVFRFAFFAVLVLSFSQIGFSQRSKKKNNVENLLMGTSWKADGTPFETSDREMYQFTTYDPLVFEGRYGYFIDFDTTTFSTHYSAPCGNDCFTSLQGEYKFVGAFTISVQVNSINRYGFCGKESEKPNRHAGNYLLERFGKGWKVSKVKN